MFADAVSAEAYRLIRNRSTLFWSAIFVPVGALIVSIVVNLVTQANTAKLDALKLDVGVTGAPVDLGQALVATAGQLANPGLLLFLTIGAATLFAGDYRWETWRLVIARNRRPSLILAKLAVMAGLAVAAMLLFMLCGLLAEMIKAVIFERGVSFSIDAGDLGRLAAVSALCLWRILQFVMLGLLAAVVSRSLLAALFVPLAIGAAQAIAAPMLMGLGWMPDGWPTLLSLPGSAFDMIRPVLWLDQPVPAEVTAALPRAVIGLMLWTLAPLAAALAVFSRQDLSKE